MTSLQRNKQSTSSDSGSSKVGSGMAKGNSGPAKKPKSGGTIVKSRYLQPVLKSNSKNDESLFIAPPRPVSPKPGRVLPRVGTPPRHTMAPQSLARVGSPSRRSMAPQSLTQVGSPSRRSMAPHSLTQVGSPSRRSMAPHSQVGTPPRLSMAPQPLTRVSTPPRRTMAPPTSLTPTYLESTQLEKSVLQSTIMEGHQNRPDFDVSAINDRTVIQNTADRKVALASEAATSEEVDVENETFLLAFLTAKMEHNTRKMKAEAEANSLAVMKAEEELRKEIHEKKRKQLLRKKKRQLNELLNLQNAALTPVAAATQHFTDQYKCFAAAVDATRHQLPVKNLHVQGDRGEFLNKAATCLRMAEELILQCTQGDQQDNQTSLQYLRELTTGGQDISRQLSEVCSELTELSCLATRHAVLTEQSLEEERMGSTAQHLYFPAESDVS